MQALTMLQASVEALIKQQTGIDAKIVGSGLIRSAVERCMRQRQIADLPAYWQLLQRDPRAVQELVETVVVPETWFFRDRSPFQFLVTHVQGLIKSQQSRLSAPLKIAPLKILSVPCSTGEEPYSIAMALLQAGIPPAQFQIDAIDISQKNIQQALVGIYSPFSFRNNDVALKATFFTPAGRQYQLQDRVKRLVKFRVGNILQPLTGGISGSYDIIFCRNLLIYFDPDTRQKVIARLNQLLKPTGMLFVGHAESSLLLNAGWQGVRIPFTFAYQKSTQPGLKLLERASAQALVKSITKVQQTASIVAAAPLPVSIGTHDLPLVEVLEQARQAADRGDFSRAQQLCAQQLQITPLQPDWHLLLGQIHQAQAQPDLAETAFSKALYLQPDCLEALVHLARLKQSRGDGGGADRLYARIERLQSKVRPEINV
jgi:chemotaxis protein methyltransferase WspC